MLSSLLSEVALQGEGEAEQQPGRVLRSSSEHAVSTARVLDEVPTFVRSEQLWFLVYDTLHVSSGTRDLDSSVGLNLSCSSEHAASAAIRVG